MDAARDAAAFDERADAWDRWREAPWNRLRYRLVAHTLARAVDVASGGPLRVLDVGGGDGGDALPLARLGHHVTVLDHAATLLERAERAAADAGLTEHVRVLLGDLDDAAALGPRFDLVLCHNVLHYRDDPAHAVSVVAGAARPDGTVSLLSPNPAMDVLARAVRLADPAGALALLDAPALRSETFGREMRRWEPDDAARALGAAGCVVTHRFGIRCVNDLVADDGLKHDPTFAEQLEHLELALCDREPYLRTARFWHLVARRRP
ncbi:methyltransferase domain-containing protein [Actinomadura logoneensis]|uniref:Methyltransferase domain-containing protein n=1 Tax=Actinomadura logoneensis TaxID=2293572 RepID=A0A372JMR8_9ACTN|nr:methyltransferase domain-containing protein [Actinomadura logoneensis]RFU41074.1 methyltransferase domain-containing protein [Actinomadura logoneensis]